MANFDTHLCMRKAETQKLQLKVIEFKARFFFLIAGATIDDLLLQMGTNYEPSKSGAPPSKGRTA